MKLHALLAVTLVATPATAQVAVAGTRQVVPAPAPIAAPLTVPAPVAAPVTAPSSVPAPVGAPTTIRGSKHDLSKNGPGPVKAARETDTCVFCHVSHRGEGLGNNRPESRAAYRSYGSSTMAAKVRSAPSGASRICLSCHDGTIALGKTRTRTIETTGTPDGRMPGGASNLGTDLRGMHPVSFKPAEDRKVLAPEHGDRVRLDPSGELQCTACHDPHRQYVDPEHGKFLVKTTRASALCLSCHTATTYQPRSSAHGSATATADPSLLATGNASEKTVAQAGCLACHSSHDGDPRGRMVKRGSGDDTNCLACHDGKVGVDVASRVARTSAHVAARYGPSGHDAAEGRAGAPTLPETSPSADRHVTCADCHNPHATSTAPAVAPNAPGALAGVWGIDRNGLRVEPARYEYEVCFKCHGDSRNQPQERLPPRPGEPQRAVLDVNLRRTFDPASPSFHPVVAPGRSTDVPSLLAPLTPRSQVYCGDCHGPDDAAPTASALRLTSKALVPRTPAGALLATRAAAAPAPAPPPSAVSAPGASGGTRVARGPHGSNLEHLLSLPYATADGTAESPAAYALCYRCHDRDVVLSDESTFPLHTRHVVSQGAPCSACHGSHGVSSVAGNPINNAHLIDFDVSIVRTTRAGVRQYTSRGARAGSCTLSCHGKEHEAVAYPVIRAASPARLKGYGTPLAPAMKPRETR